MPYVLRKTPDPENRQDHTTITMEFGDQVNAHEFAAIVGDFMKACGYHPSTSEDVAEELVKEIKE